MMRNLILAGLIWSLGDGKALADDAPSTPADQPIVTTEESTSVVAPLTLSPPLNPDCPDQPDIPGLQAEYNAYNNATYASALEAKGLVPTTMKLKWNALTYDPDARERTPWKVTRVNGERVLPGEVIHSDCGPSARWTSNAQTVHFGTKKNHSVFLKRDILYRLEVTRPAVVTKSLTRCGCPDYSGWCGAESPSSDQPLWVLPEGVKYGGVLEIEAPQKVLDIQLIWAQRCDPPA
jgi:hypothetical protein